VAVCTVLLEPVVGVCNLLLVTFVGCEIYRY